VAGHSHWARIKHKKAVVDSRRGRAWSKLSRRIIVAARTGGGDPDQNLSLRYAIDKAKEANMPRDTIEKAIKRGSGALEGSTFEDVLYEGYGPKGVAVMAQALTDNRNRTAGEIRKVFERVGGSLGATNCVAFQFSRKGLFAFGAESATEDQVMELALAGEGDYRLDGATWEITCDPARFEALKSALSTANIKSDVAEITMMPLAGITVDADTGKRLLRFIEELEEHDDIQTVYSNFDIPEDVMNQMEQAAE
jgi:YebC/PmpR family DNA-binding regulatory protein